LRFDGRSAVLYEGGGDVAASLTWLKEQLSAATADRAAGHRRLGAIRVRMGASLCRPVVVDSVQGELNAVDRLRAAKAMAAARSGLSVPCSVWLDREDDRGRRMAVVAEQIVLDRLELIATKLRLRLESIRPWWAEVLNEALSSQPGLRAMAAWEDDVLTLLAGSPATISLARAMASIHDAATARAAFLRMCMAEGIDPAHSVAVALDLEATVEARGPLTFGKVALE
jgi:hypothetical protein